MEKIKAKKLKVVNEKTLIATVDLAKGMNTGYCRCPDGSEMKPFEFGNNWIGFEKFWNSISTFKAEKGLEEIVVGFESTGVYGEPLVHYLRKKPVRLVQVNPMHTKRLKELNDNSPNKSDKKDPKVIADIIKLGHTLTVIIPEGAAAELRGLTQARERSIQRRTALYNQLQDLIFKIFPEFLQVMKDVKTKSAQYVLNRYPTPEDIVRCGVESLAGEFKEVSRGKLGIEQASALYSAAEVSVGVKEGREVILFEIREVLALIERDDRFIEGLEGQMETGLKEVPCSRYILSMEGIGKVSAAGLIGEVGDFGKFDTMAEVEKLAGLDLFEISSGKHRGLRRISKRGRPLLRKLLFFAALNTVRKGGAMREEYQRHLDKGMLKMKALIAISRKLLRVIFSLVHNHSEYVMNYTKVKNIKEAA